MRNLHNPISPLWIYKKVRGFTLLEILMVLAVTSTLAAVAAVQFMDTTASVKSTKLQQDVAALNRAVRTYAMSGGDLTTARTGSDIIAKLKSTTQSQDRSRIAGLRGAMVDTRLLGVPSTENGAQRAVWDSSRKVFLVETKGDGFREFILYDNAAQPAARVEEKRNILMALDTADKWVWNYGEGKTTASAPRVESGQYVAPYSTPAGQVSITVLQAPAFSKETGAYKISEFKPNLDVSLVERNPANLAELFYSIANGPWKRWDGNPLPIPPDAKTEVRAYSAPLNPDQYEQSATVSAVYESKPRLQPLLRFENLPASYTYADIGGSFLPGSAPPPAPRPAPRVVLANPGTIPLSQQNSNFFEVRWSTDGTNPLTSPGASVTGSFSNGFPGQELGVNLSLWGTRSSLPLQAVSKSLQLDDLADSPVLAPVISAARTVLPPPSIMETAPLNGVRQITIQADIASGLIPPGTRIYYTMDGTIPGVVRDQNGLDNATAGQLYTGPVPLPAEGEDMVITARLYPPAHLPQWFSASETSSQDLPIGLGGGHIDVDTASQLYPFRRGTTDGHVHAYDKKYNVTGASFFNFASSNLRNLQQVVPAGTKFKIIVANANLSPGGRLVINNTYDPSHPPTWQKVKNYSNASLDSLPVYSLEGLPGTTRLREFGLYFDLSAIGSGDIIPTSTGQVRSNVPGRFGEWRNGALTIQVVRVNADGSDAFTTDPALSSGGKQGVATSGLLWESTFFYHSKGGAYAN